MKNLFGKQDIKHSVSRVYFYLVFDFGKTRFSSSASAQVFLCKHQSCFMMFIDNTEDRAKQFLIPTAIKEENNHKSCED